MNGAAAAAAELRNVQITFFFRLSRLIIRSVSIRSRGMRSHGKRTFPDAATNPKYLHVIIRSNSRCECVSVCVCVCCYTLRLFTGGRLFALRECSRSILRRFLTAARCSLLDSQSVRLPNPHRPLDAPIRAID